MPVKPVRDEEQEVWEIRNKASGQERGKYEAGPSKRPCGGGVSKSEGH